MHLILILLMVLALVYGPGLWVQVVFRRYSRPADRYAFTGAEIARRLLDRLDLKQVRVEVSQGGDHYDPDEKVIRLARDKHDGRSLTAIAVAAHEVGHAYQDAKSYPPLKWRTSLVRRAVSCQRLGALILMISPLVVLVTRAPVSGALTILGGILILGLSTVVHLITLPVEFDASFRRALPMLTHLGLLQPGDEPHVRRLLKAAAMTYVASSLMGLLNVARWWAVLRR